MIGQSAPGATKGELRSVQQDINDVQSTIAEEETTQFASKAYVVGNYINYDNNLYKVIQPISMSDPLVVNGNIELTTVGAELKSISDSSGGSGEGGGQTVSTIVPVPNVTINTYSYSGSPQGPIITGLDTAYVTVMNTTATNVGTYQMIAILNDPVRQIWSDFTYEPKTWDYRITKASQTIIASKESIELISGTVSDTATITLSSGDGTLSATSSDTSIATCTLSNNTLTVTKVAPGETTIVITASDTNNCMESKITLPVTVSNVVGDLDSTSWADISAASAAGLASTYWSIGDCKKIVLNGTIGTKVYDNVEVYVYIIGFDHNAELEGYGISFGCFKTAKYDEEDIGVYDDCYGLIKSTKTISNISSSKLFNMFHYANVNSSGTIASGIGGWRDCDLRYDILGSTDVQPNNYNSTSSHSGYDATTSCATTPVPDTLMAALPEDLRNVMKPINKYTQSTWSIDYLPLLSEFEVLGRRVYAYETESNNQAQYQYYIDNPDAYRKGRIRKWNDMEFAQCTWWSRSITSTNNPSYTSAVGFYATAASGGSNSYSPYESDFVLSPVFLV